MISKEPFCRATVYTARLFVCGLSVCAGLARASAATAGYTPTPFSHYQPILDRMPFGPPPSALGQPAVDPALVQSAAQLQVEQQKLAKQINMSCINVTPDGTTAIGFTDLEAKPPVNYYLLVGASAGGWTVVEADYDAEWAQIEKGDVSITLKLGKGLIDGPPNREAAAVAKTSITPPVTPAAAPAAAPVPVPAPAAEAAPVPRSGLIRRPSQGGRPSVNTASLQRSRSETDQVRQDIEKIKSDGGDVMSYMQRLKERKQQESDQKAAAEESARTKLQDLARKITQEELAKKEREMNLNLIEQGAKPISDIELTPEEEADLVDKGVLAQ
ncbi:MAG: hypothetical protein WCK89_08145 [bacterium]